MDVANPPIELLAAPVMEALRYEHRPIYFSDVVVRRDSPFRIFAEMPGLLASTGPPAPTIEWAEPAALPARAPC